MTSAVKFAEGLKTPQQQQQSAVEAARLAAAPTQDPCEPQAYPIG